MYLLGFDIGSSSIKAALVHTKRNGDTCLVQSPEREMEIMSPKSGWAEQDPEIWWEHVCIATKKLLQKSGIKPEEIKGIGISYQMHGLVLVDEKKEVLRPSIIWCDSRAVEIGENAFKKIGTKKCLNYLLNSPGNFTASKLTWVKQNEPELFSKIWKIMLPGDYIAMRLTGEIFTTASGLSEGVLWDFQKNELADYVLNHFEISSSIIPTVVGTCSHQGKLTHKAAKSTGLTVGTPVTYRAGDQPNNAMSLNVLNAGEVAATGGTSGVVYAVVDRPVFDPKSRVNSFLHVNHQTGDERIGVLMCINGAGSQYAWLKKQMADADISYFEMEKMASNIPIGSDNLRILPFGNGAERILENRDLGAQIRGLNFNLHKRSHFYRAALEGIAFSIVYGLEILKSMGLDVKVMRVGNDNLFQSQIFSRTISNLIGCRIEIIETTGAIGAARTAGVGVGIFSSIEEAMDGVEILKTIEPENKNERYLDAFRTWSEDLSKELKK